MTIITVIFLIGLVFVIDAKLTDINNTLKEGLKNIAIVIHEEKNK